MEDLFTRLFLLIITLVFVGSTAFAFDMKLSTLDPVSKYHQTESGDSEL